MLEHVNQHLIVLTSDSREAMPLLASGLLSTQRGVADLQHEYVGAVVLFRSGDIRRITSVTEAPPTGLLARLKRSLLAGVKSIDVRLEPSPEESFSLVKQRMVEFFLFTDHIEEWDRRGVVAREGSLRQALVDACRSSQSADELFRALGLASDDEFGDQLC